MTIVKQEVSSRWWHCRCSYRRGANHANLLLDTATLWSLHKSSDKLNQFRQRLGQSSCSSSATLYPSIWGGMV